MTSAPPASAVASGLPPEHGASHRDGSWSEHEPVPAPADQPDAAFEAAYQHYHAALLSWLRSRTGDQSLAEDLCQEAFARLLRQIRAGRLPDSMPAWLRTVGRNLYISRLRRDRVARHKAPSAAVSVAGDPTLETALEHERVSAARAALTVLSAPERDLIILALRGLTAPQMAALLGTSPGAVRTRLHRARRSLRGAVLALRPIHPPRARTP